MCYGSEGRVQFISCKYNTPITAHVHNLTVDGNNVSNNLNVACIYYVIFCLCSQRKEAIFGGTLKIFLVIV